MGGRSDEGAASARQLMVDRQLRTNDVTDLRILKAMGSVPRALFVADSFRQNAYIDSDVPVTRVPSSEKYPGSAARTARYLLKPVVFARLIQAAEIRANERVLVIGCGRGYSVAVLSFLAKEVIGVEEPPFLVEAARATLRALQLNNTKIIESPLVEGAPREGPYACVLIEGAVGRIPASLKEQLAEGGRLLTIEGDTRQGRALLYLKTGNEVTGRRLFEARASVLPGFEAEQFFSF